VKRSNRLVILVGVLLAVLAFVAIVILLNQDPEPTGPGPNAVPDEATVLVAAQDIEIGDVVTPDMVETRDIPVAAVQTDVLVDSSELTGEPAIRALPAGAQVTQAVSAASFVNQASVDK
jgi:Flp pilus assembly protein CpaB